MCRGPGRQAASASDAEDAIRRADRSGVQKVRSDPLTERVITIGVLYPMVAFAAVPLLGLLNVDDVVSHPDSSRRRSNGLRHSGQSPHASPGPGMRPLRPLKAALRLAPRTCSRMVSVRP